MSRLIFALLSGSFALCILPSDFTRLEANSKGWGRYGSERGAWGGNGGWWGDSHNDWYGEYGSPDQPREYGGIYRRNTRYSNPYSPAPGYHYNGYYYDNSYPYGGQYYYGDNTVDGAALYFNVPVNVPE